jgi:hypothetical protein
MGVISSGRETLTRSLAQKQGTFRGAFCFALNSGAYCGMREKTFLVLLKPPDGRFQHVVAARTRRRGDHLAFVDANGRLVASFLIDLVESWVEFMSLEEVTSVRNSAELSSRKQ